MLRTHISIFMRTIHLWLFSFNVFVRFWYQNHAGLKAIWENFPFLYFLKRYVILLTEFTTETLNLKFSSGEEFCLLIQFLSHIYMELFRCTISSYFISGMMCFARIFSHYIWVKFPCNILLISFVPVRSVVKFGPVFPLY